MSINDSDAAPGAKPDLAAQARNDLETVTGKAKSELSAVTQRAAEDVRELRHEASAKVSEATDKAKSFAGNQKDLAAEQINGVAAAIAKVADELDGTDQQTIGRYARDLSSGLSSLGNTIENRDVDDLMGIAQDFGRKQPVAFLGAAALAGFVASRFALASAHRRESRPRGDANRQDAQSGYGQGTSPGDAATPSSSTYSGGQ